jgi:putative oxidoreductase
VAPPRPVASITPRNLTAEVFHCTLGVVFPRHGKEATNVDTGRLLLRMTVGSIFIEHGTQKLFGWFGGHGPDGTGQFFESVGLRPGRRNAIAAGTGEAGGGALLALGLATPLAASALTSVMLTALRTVVWRDGIKMGSGGYEIVLGVGALALADLGPGGWSLDGLLGFERRGAAWAAAAFGAAAVGSTLAIELGKRQGPAPGEEGPSEPAAPSSTAADATE